MVIEIAYIPHACVFESLQGEWRDANFSGMEHTKEFVPSIRCEKSDDKNHLGHT
jgi:hypothetical protein